MHYDFTSSEFVRHLPEFGGKRYNLAWDELIWCGYDGELVARTLDGLVKNDDLQWKVLQQGYAQQHLRICELMRGIQYGEQRRCTPLGLLNLLGDLSPLTRDMAYSLGLYRRTAELAQEMRMQQGALRDDAGIVLQKLPITISVLERCVQEVKDEKGNVLYAVEARVRDELDKLSTDFTRNKPLNDKDPRWQMYKLLWVFET